MKLVAIMSVASSADSLKKLYDEHGVPVFSEADIKGFRLSNSDLEERSWFGGSRNPVYSKLTFAFLMESKATELMNAIEQLNDSDATGLKISAFQLDVDRSIQ